MKVKLSPFTILFLSLNSILIFCASRKINPEKKPSSRSTYTNMDIQINPADNIDSQVYDTWVKKTKTHADKASDEVVYKKTLKIMEDAKSLIEVSAKDDIADGPDALKTEVTSGALVHTISGKRTKISPMLRENRKIDATANYTGLANYFGYVIK